MKPPYKLRWLIALNIHEQNEYDNMQYLNQFDHEVLGKPFMTESKKRKLDILVGECNIYELLIQEILTHEKNSNPFKSYLTKLRISK